MDRYEFGQRYEPQPDPNRLFTTPMGQSGEAGLIRDLIYMLVPGANPAGQLQQGLQARAPARAAAANMESAHAPAPVDPEILMELLRNLNPTTTMERGKSIAAPPGRQVNNTRNVQR